MNESQEQVRVGYERSSEGVVIPTARSQGGSMGVDPNKALPQVIIDGATELGTIPGGKELKGNKVDMTPARVAADVPYTRGEDATQWQSQQGIVNAYQQRVQTQVPSSQAPLDTAAPPPFAALPSTVPAILQPASAPTPPAPPIVSRPTHKVQFHHDSFGVITVPYHDVVESGLFLILVFDNSDTFSAQYSPPDKGRDPMYVVVDQDVAFHALSCGINFNYDNKTFTVLFIVPSEEQ